MGSCLGRCISKQPSTSSTSSSSCMWRQATDEQEADLMSNASDKQATKRNFIFRILKFKRKHKNGEQFLDHFWERQDLNYAKLTNTNNCDGPTTNIQLQNLDVNHLVTAATNAAKESALNNNNAMGAYTNAAAIGSSRASSSLDLEWEHEYVHIQRQFASLRQQQQDKEYQQQHKHKQQQHEHHQHEQQQREHIEDEKNSRIIAQQQYNQDVVTQQQFNDDAWQIMLLHNDDHENDDSCQLNSYNSYERDSIAPPQFTPSQQQQSINGDGIATNNIAGVMHGQQHMKPTTTTTTNINRNGSFTRGSSSHNNSWSHISTPESLEWDIDEEQQQQRQMHVEDDNLDHETLQLLYQIEQLKNRVLNETGDGVGVDHTADDSTNGVKLNLNTKNSKTLPAEIIDNS